jgi:hypothetical protein
MQMNHEAALEKQVDKQQYSDAQLISIKTTLNLPYYTSSPEYERAYGSINIDGKDYVYVKRRVYQDTLELLCLPNHIKTKLQAVSNDLSKSFIDGQASAPNKKSITVLKISLPDFFQQINTNLTSLVTIMQQPYFSYDTNFCFADYSSRQEHPPQLMQEAIF